MQKGGGRRERRRYGLQRSVQSENPTREGWEMVALFGTHARLAVARNRTVGSNKEARE